MKATTLFQTVFDPRSTHKVMGSKVARVPAGAISGFPHGSLEKEKPFGCRPCGEVQSIL